MQRYDIPFEDSPELYVDLLALHFPIEKVQAIAEELNYDCETLSL